MSQISALLDRIVKHLSHLKRPVVGRLQAGLSHTEIEEKTPPKPRLPQSLFELYGWKNGTDISRGDTLGALYFFPGYYLMNLEEATARYASLTSVDSGWKEQWFPLFCSGGGDFFGIGCGALSAVEGPIVEFLRGDPEHKVRFKSLSVMLKSIEECYHSKAYFVTDDGYLEVDDKKASSIAKKINAS